MDLQLEMDNGWGESQTPLGLGELMAIISPECNSCWCMTSWQSSGSSHNKNISCLVFAKAYFTAWVLILLWFICLFDPWCPLPICAAVHPVSSFWFSSVLRAVYSSLFVRKHTVSHCCGYIKWTHNFLLWNGIYQPTCLVWLCELWVCHTGEKTNISFGSICLQNHCYFSFSHVLLFPAFAFWDLYSGRIVNMVYRMVAEASVLGFLGDHPKPNTSAGGELWNIL